MAQAKRKKKKLDAVLVPTTPSFHNLREVMVFVLLTIAVFLTIALFTYNQNDPGWSHAVSSDAIHNKAGQFGAWLADVFLYVLGYVGYLIPILIAFGCWRLYEARRQQRVFSTLHLSLRIIGLLVFIFGSAGLAWGHFYTGSGLPFEVRGAGGVIGDIAGSFLNSRTGHLGSTLILLMMILTGITLFTGFSWFWLMDKTGEISFTVFDYIKGVKKDVKVQTQGRQARKERETVLKKDTEKNLEREPVVIQDPIISDFESSIRSETEKQETLFDAPADSRLPTLNLLDDPTPSKGQYSRDALAAISRQVEIKLKDFGIEVQVLAVHPGPVVTRFELEPAPGTKVSKISNLSKDLARSLSVVSVRVVEVIPGKSVIGLEIPNENRDLVTLGEIINSREYESVKTYLPLALGKDIAGKPVVTDLAKMPHLLVAGTTGSGKSVALNAMILSLLYTSMARDVRMIMIDPKMLELSVYEGIPHLLSPVVTDMKEAANALRWCVAEMERRYKLMAALGVRNISGYNKKITDAERNKQPIKDPLYQPVSEEEDVPELQQLPLIVVIIDELADMMMTVGKKVEELIARLAQKARAAGIHLIVATQRPSVDVITGLIKANIPCRMAFQVSSKVDSRTILDQMGAENLLGHGDMLFLAPGSNIPERVHGAFVDDHEVHRIVEYISGDEQPDYNDEIIRGPDEGGAELIPGIESSSGEDMDPLYDEAVRIVTETRKASISYIQRRLKIGYNRAARIVEEMENSGLVGPLESNGSREIYAAAPPPID